MCSANVSGSVRRGRPRRTKLEALVAQAVRGDVKLAGAGRRDRPLLALEPEREDSGIDSDDARRSHRHHCHSSSEESGSDDELVAKPPWVRAVKRKNDELLKEMGDDNGDNPEAVPMMQWQHARCGQDLLKKQYCDSEDCDRNSPPLYEIELTASDEDDDGSVLELVIPMHMSSRYHRVPKSSPNKLLSIAPTFLSNLFCCLRK